MFMRCCRSSGLGLAALLGALALTWLPVQARAATLGGQAVEVTNASEPVLCAEKDNVTVNMASPLVRQFRIEAAHPSYIGSLQRDSFDADWTACDMTGDPVYAAPTPPRRVTLYEDIELWVVGLTFPTFWRPATATLRIGDRVEKGLHLVQIWMIRPMGGEEVLVLYPQDGYWRIRPKAPAGMAPTAFGSSFLIGPVEMDGRPIVRFEEIAFEPGTRTFTLKFARGGTASVKMATTDQARHVLDVALDQPVAGLPFAALRSMYVTEFNNDVARIAVRERGAKGWREDPIMVFKSATATHVWAGRTALSRHNTSSPDMVFKSFAADAPSPGKR